jgi:hypothetical protein
MKVLDPGHLYEVPNLEAEGTQQIRFIKRNSDMVQRDEEYAGTNTQEVIRVLIDRTKYLNTVGYCEETANAVSWLQMALYEYEARAWRRKQQKLNKRAKPQAETDGLNAYRDAYRDVPFTSVGIEDLPTGPDGHVIVDPDVEHERSV